jgi:hypothetical protein
MARADCGGLWLWVVERILEDGPNVAMHRVFAPNVHLVSQEQLWLFCGISTRLCRLHICLPFRVFMECSPCSLPCPSTS